MAATRLTHDARRAAILDAAVKLFSEKGFRGTTTRELAAAVGVTEPVLYQHFSTKSELYKAILEERAVADGRRMPENLYCFGEPGEDDRQFLVRLATGIIEWHTSNPTYIRLLLFSTLEGHELADLFHDQYTKAFLEALAQYFETRMLAEDFRRMDPMLAAHTFVGIAAHYGMSRTIFRRGALDLPQDQTVEGLVDIFLEGIRNRHE
jgi:AcrR family transcriptional regulator